MKDFFQYRDSLTEARKRPGKKKGEDYTDGDLEDSSTYWRNESGQDSMITHVKISDIKKITRASVKKMSSKDKKEMYDLLQDDYEMLDHLATANNMEAMTLEDYLDTDDPDHNPDGIKSLKRDIKFYYQQERKIKKHMDLILKHEKLL